MTSKKTFPAYRMILGAFFLTAVIAVGCNEGAEKKEPVPDTPKVTTPVIDTPAPPIDTSKMKEASTRPVKTTD